MQIQRTAANKHTFWSSLVEKHQFYAYWSKDEGLLEFRNSRSNALNAQGEYKHRVRLTLEECVDLISVLSAEALRESPDKLNAALVGHHEALIRLLACSTGLKPTAPPSDERDDQ